MSSLVLIGLLGSTVTSAPRDVPRAPTWTLSPPAGIQIPFADLAGDGVHALVVLRGDATSRADMTRSLPGDLESHEVPLPCGLTELWLRPQTLVLRRVTLEGHRIQLWGELPSAIIRARVARPIPRSVPSVFAGPAYQGVERAIAAQSFRRAARELERLLEDPALSAWASVRFADVALLDGKRLTACHRYAETARRYPERTAGLLARIRRRSLGCPGEHFGRGDLTELLARLEGIEGAVGRLLREEALVAVDLERTATGLGEAIQALRAIPPKTLGLSPKRRDRLVARLASARLHFEIEDLGVAATFERYREILRSHAAWADHLLRAARALVALDLGTEAIPLLRKVRGASRRSKPPGWSAREPDAQTSRLLSEAYRSIGEIGRAEAALARDPRARQCTAPVVIPSPPPQSAQTPSVTSKRTPAELLATLHERLRVVEARATQEAHARRRARGGRQGGSP